MGKVSLSKQEDGAVVRKRKKKPFFKRVLKVSSHVSLLILSDLWGVLRRHTWKIVSLFAVFLLVVVLGSGYSYVRSTVLETSSFSDEYILEKVGKHMTVPSEYPQSLVRVEDSETLKRELPFDAKVKNGDYIIVYPRLYIIYDAQHDTIVFTKESQR